MSICRQKRVHSSLQRGADRPADEFLLSSSCCFLLITSRRPSGRMLDTMHQFHVFKTRKRRCHPAYGCSTVVKITAFFTDLRSSDPSSSEFHQSCTAPDRNDGFRLSGPAQGSGRGSEHVQYKRTCETRPLKAPRGASLWKLRT